MKPTIGRIVHFYEQQLQETESIKYREGLDQSKPIAAIVTDIDNAGRTYLQPFYPNRYTVMGIPVTRCSTDFVGPIPYSDKPQAGHWSWPSSLEGSSGFPSF